MMHDIDGEAQEQKRMGLVVVEEKLEEKLEVAEMRSQSFTVRCNGRHACTPCPGLKEFLAAAPTVRTTVSRAKIAVIRRPVAPEATVRRERTPTWVPTAS